MGLVKMCLHTQRVILVKDGNFTHDSKENLKAFIGWKLHWSTFGYDVEGELILADPADASSSLRNWKELNGRVAVVLRGNVPIHAKLQRIQHSGAVGAIIVDTTGKCDTAFDSKCARGANKHFGEGFALHDDPT